ncbi:hypothetical protein GE061_013142 [Apolygus lucorum]|uniref:Uncharacterized protein n=1 Tax=Apolygus lucorum TaxID=248454 RepID=A0A8S9XWZ8_APOLU|nr:hypothetical protein GE061_013142 [Apolygus lucorum]
MLERTRQDDSYKKLTKALKMKSSLMPRIMPRSFRPNKNNLHSRLQSRSKSSSSATSRSHTLGREAENATSS